MPHDVHRWPRTVYPDEVSKECPEAMEVIDVLIGELRRQGPSPDGYHAKNLGGRMGGLWQINLKVEKRQIRVLYAPYKSVIVLFRIHKKSSSQEQSRAYDLAKARKTEYDNLKRKAEQNGQGNRTLH